MKKMNIKFLGGVLLILLATSSCNDFLDINDNPNRPITADVQLVLPQAIVASASVANQFNSYGAHFGGFMANAGGFSGFGNLLSYNLTPGDWNNLWVTTFQDPLADFKYVIDKTEGIDELAHFNAAAKIMTVVNYQRLVDAFGDIPYSNALQGAEGETGPSYDDAKTIYQDLLATLDEAIGIIDNAKFPQALTAASDPLFDEYGSDGAAHALAWKKYANTLKLRILIRLSSTTDVTAGFASLNTGIGFLENDAIVDPGYEKNRPNPAWASWGKTTADALANSSRIPTSFAFAFYGGTGSKISDTGRGETIFVNYPATPTNQLGNEVGNPTIVSGLVTWASNQTGFIGTGVLKGPAMGQPLMLKAESHFLQAEAQLKGYLGGNARTSFYAGIGASFAYLFKNEAETMLDTAGRVSDYRAANVANKLVDYPILTTDAERLEAIITQKYIAMNMITSDEAYNEYRRTGFPKSVSGGGPRVDIASNKSTITTRPDRLPTRIMYPSSEQSFNAEHYKTVNYSSELIFWDPN
jgi:hypothetical protein